MKIRLTLLFLAIATLSFAQKKEMRKIESALKSMDYAKALTVFNSIDANEVEEKYQTKYDFYKALSLVGVPGVSQPSLENLNEASQLLSQVKSKGFENIQMMEFVETSITDAKFNLARRLLENKDSSGALKIVEDIYESDTTNLEMLYNAATLAYQAQLWDKSAMHYRELLNKGYTGSYNSYYGVDANGNKTKMSKTAIEVGLKNGAFVKMEESKSESKLGEILMNLTWLYAKEGKQDAAKDIFTTTLSKYPKDQTIRDASASIYLQLGMMDDYKSAMEKLLKGKKDPVVFENLANAALTNGNYTDAIKFYDKCLELQGDNVAALNNASNAFIQVANKMKFDKNTVTGSYKDAVENFNEGKRSTYLKALDYLERAHKLDGENKSVIQNLLSLYSYFKMDDKAAALKAKM